VKTNGLAIASLVLGLIWLWFVGSILAIIFGFIALNQIKESGGRQTGRGLAIAGIVLGFAWTGLVVVAIIAITFLGSEATSKFSIIGPTVNDVLTHVRVLTGR